MTFAVTHTKIADIPDDPAFEIRTTEWNDQHVLNMVSGNILGRLTAGTGTVEELSFTQVTAQLGVFTATLKGLVPSSGGGTTNFLRADGTWAIPPGGGGGTPGGSSGQVQYNNAGAFGGFTLGGDATLVTSTGVMTIGSQAVTYAKIQNISAASLLLGRGSAAGAGTTQEIALGTNLSMSGTTLNATSPTGQALTKTDDTNVTLTLGGSPTVALLAATSVTVGWTGLLASARGGTANGFFTVAGPASSAKTFTFPNSSQTVGMLDLADQTVSGGANVTSLSLTTGNITIDCGARPLQFITNNGAFTITAPANDGSCMLLVTNGASAGAIAFSGFTVGSNTGDALTTTNTNKFTISIWRINGTSGYRIAAHQ